ncbi:MAG: two-component regulator propeller domain-containing protein [Xanthomonadales bacterium]|nr:two-component regulator propeller domain-containing protein [Xanthomonadales bacterium]
MAPWLLLATVLGAPGGMGEIGGPRLVPIGDQRSVPDGVVTDLAADPRGFLWIGTTQGLVRFDGYDFRRFVSDERDPGRGPGGNLVRALHVGRDGRLWIGFDRSVVSVLDPEEGRFASYRLGPLEDPRFAGASAMALADDGRGRILVALRGAGIGIVEERPEGPRVRVIRLARAAEPPAPEDLAHAVAAGPEGTVWIGADAGLLTLDGEDRLALAWTARDEGKPDPVYSLLWSGARLWAGTLNGRLLYREGGRVVVVEEPSPETAGLRDTIYRLLALPEAGELWVARATGLELRALADGRLLRRIRPEPDARPDCAPRICGRSPATAPA